MVSNRYRVLAKIASGGMATVYRAHDETLSRDIALKVMHAHLATGASGHNFVSRFQREAKAAAGLTHPGLVAIFDQGVDSNVSYLSMELVPGANLRTIMAKDQTLSVGRTLDITAQLLDALATAHRAGLVHRDIKPENVLIEPSRRVKLADFGLARAVTEVTSTTTGSLLGTVAYLSPELITTGQGDTRSDLYSIGVMAYEMISGAPTVAGESPIHVAFQHANTDIAPLSSLVPALDPRVDAFIGALVARDPAGRPHDASAALEQLHSILPELSESAAALRVRAPLGPVPQPEPPSTGTHTAVLKNSSGDTSVIPTSFEPRPAPMFAPVTTTQPASAANAKGAHGAPQPGKDAPTGTKPPKVKTGPKKSNRTQPGSQPPSGTRRRPGLAITIWAAVLLLLGGGTYAGLNWWHNSGPGAYTTVPFDVLDVPVADALAKFAAIDLATKAATAYDDTVAVDHVIRVNPEMGQRIRKDSTVTITTSLGVEHHEVPADLVGNDIKDATSALTEIGFDNLKTEEIYRTGTKVGQVLDSSAQAGASLPHNGLITLTVSKGPEPIIVPPVRGLTEDKAKTELAKFDLGVKVDQAFSDTIEKGLVISQSPEAQANGHRGDQVTIVLSRGPELFEVPKVTGMSAAQATTTLEKAGFKVKKDYVLGGIFDLVHSLTPGDGKMVPKGTTITIKIV